MSSFTENVFKLLTGSLLAQGLVLICTPIITRLYLPDAFGIAALFTSITSIIAAISCLRYELAIMLPKDDRDAANLLCLCICLILLFSIISALTVFFAGTFIARIINSPQLTRFLWLLPIAIFFAGIIIPLNQWNSRFKTFGSISIAQVTAAGVVQTSRLLAGFAGIGTGGALIVTQIFGFIVAPVVLGIRIWTRQKEFIQSNVHWDKIVEGLKRYKKFPLYGTWSVLLNNASMHLPVILLAFYFSPSVVGFYALGRAVLSIPMGLLGRAIANVFYQKASDVHSQSGDLSAVVEEVFKRLVSLGMFPIFMLILIGKDLFIIAFGRQWAEAGIYVQILAIWILFQFISSPISTLFSVLERQRDALVFNMLLFGTRVASLVLGGMTGNIQFTLVLFALTGAGCYGLLSFWLISKVGMPIGNAIKQLAKYGLYSSPFLILIWFAKWVWGVQEMGLLLLSFSLLSIYYLHVVWQDKALRKIPFALLRRFTFIR
jgi:lipopolysaccharide exporter